MWIVKAFRHVPSWRHGRTSLRGATTCGLAMLWPPVWCAAALVPGSGQHVQNVGDDFEEPDWSYRYHAPKSSYNIDKRIRQPGGGSGNGRWSESAKRGQPDVVRRIPTPPGGLDGSVGALLMQSRYTGLPSRTSRQRNQDDLLMRIQPRLGGYLPASRQPSVVVRVFLPPWEQWEQRRGTSFALRADVKGVKARGRKQEEYWPGIFVHYDGRHRPDESGRARWILRADESGRDVRGPIVNRTGWWTLGMAFSADGYIHYYAGEGVDALTEENHLGSYCCYGFRCRRLDNVIFNVANQDAGRWSTPWIIDDPAVYIAPSNMAEARSRRSAARSQQR